MANYSFESEFRNTDAKVTLALTVISFQDETDMHIMYCPALDLAGYCDSLEGSKLSFEEVLGDFFDYTITKGSINSVLKDLGWSKSKGSAKLLIKFTQPAFSDIIKDNNYVSEIFDLYNTSTLSMNYAIPLSA